MVCGYSKQKSGLTFMLVIYWVIPIDVSTIVYTWLMYRKSISDFMVQAICQSLHSWLYLNRSRKISFSKMYGVSWFSKTNPYFEWYITYLVWPSVRRCVPWLCLINGHIWSRINLWTLHRLWWDSSYILNFSSSIILSLTSSKNFFFFKKVAYLLTKYFLSSKVVEVISHTTL